jgi:DNA repair protein RecN (Recombination protein N)
MLEELVVENYAIIDKLNVSFTSGLNILSGETGAGKSILIGALGLLLGDKTDAATIRAGSDETNISGVVRVKAASEVYSWLQDHGIVPEDEAIIVRRKVKRNGKGSIYVQSSPITLAALRELTGLLFDLHGQHEHQSLLRVESHRKLLDRYSGCEDLDASFSACYSRLLRKREAYAAMIGSEQERLRRVDLLQFSVREITEAELKPGEDDVLARELKLLANAEKLEHSLEAVLAASAESRGGALTGLRQARTALAEACRLDPELAAAAKQLDDAFYEIEDMVESVRRYRSSFNFDPARLESLESRMALIGRLKKKYGGSIEEIIEYGSSCNQELERMENADQEKEDLEAEIAALEKKLRFSAEELSGRRREGAEKLQPRIEAELKQLGMTKARFRVETHVKENEAGRPVYTPHGKDRVEFLISPNQGEPFRRLAQIASGGEISRIMLAIKTVLAESDHINSLIFDEVDVGIGGEVALAVGERLKRLGEHKQVLCITHLATIAVHADNHIKVEKVLKEGRTITLTDALEGDQRLEEIARMLAGDRRGELSLKHASELLKKYGT